MQHGRLSPCQDQNFSLFNYVADQNNDIERLEDQVSALKTEEAKHGEETGDDVHQVWPTHELQMELVVCEDVQALGLYAVSVLCSSPPLTALAFPTHSRSDSLSNPLGNPHIHSLIRSPRFNLIKQTHSLARTH